MIRTDSDVAEYLGRAINYFGLVDANMWPEQYADMLEAYLTVEPLDDLEAAYMGYAIALALLELADDASQNSELDSV